MKSLFLDEVLSLAARKPYLVSRNFERELGSCWVEFPRTTFLMATFFFGMSFFFCILRFLITRSFFSSLNERLRDRQTPMFDCSEENELIGDGKGLMHIFTVMKECFWRLCWAAFKLVLNYKSSDFFLWYWVRCKYACINKSL